MGTTVLSMDVTRTELSEARFTITRQARDISTPTQKNNLYQWPGTGTYTLQPLNLTPDFVETSHWEPLKFRLADCTFNPDWFVEVPENTKQGVGPCDYFSHGVVKNTNWKPKDGGYLEKMVDVTGLTVVSALNYEQQHSVVAMYSKSDLPANQGYCLRFRMEGREASVRAGILDFYFGDFILRLDSNGGAQLWESTDFVNYGFVYSWEWAHANQVHGRTHRIVIFPHGRNKIEFLSSSPGRYRQFLGFHHTIPQVKGHGIYQIPGEITYQANGQPLITQGGKWAMRVSREYRPAFQVSRVGFANGTNPEAFLWDSIIDITSRTGVVYAPTVPLNASVEYDKNGGTVQWGLRNFDTGQPFQSDGSSSKVQFAFGMHGIGDLPGPGLGSTVTPEIYNYTIDKPPLFLTVERSVYPALVSDVHIDHGDSPETEKLSVTSYDQGAYLRFSERGDIPLELWDADQELLLFEGTAFDVEAGEAPAQTPEGIHLEAHGMIDNLLRMEWTDTAPNFEVDPYDPEQRPFVIAEALRVCFEAGGVPRDEVVIEEEELYLKGFRFWPGSATKQGPGETTRKGEGHGTGSMHHARWHPQPNLPIHEFLDHVIRKILGWHWRRDRSDQKWHIYKRPDPQVEADADKLIPLVEFYSDGHPAVGWEGQELPSYKHADLKKKLKRPFCTTIIVQFILDTAGIKDRTELAAALSDEGNGQSSPDDPLFHTAEKLVAIPFTNLNGYVNARNPSSNWNNPDFLGRQRIKVLNVPEIAGREAAIWIGRRLYEDNCFGYLYRTFEADWGDVYTYNLRKWDMCLVNGERHYIHRIEPKWGPGKDRRAHYTVSKMRTDVRPPR